MFVSCFHRSPIEDFPVEKWDLVNDVILKGTFLLTKHALPAMQKQKKGRIINISSAHGRIPDAYKSAYCAAKFGQVGFTKVTALENALKGITCNTIEPGPVRTELIDRKTTTKTCRTRWNNCRRGSKLPHPR
ncbi:SDR family NAD(P)-dependent oxidoreductase [Peribacillus butanolivorans]|uniref:SDR family NAD(P)-dependent oxidoreductase n=1 Tax=Peribacillus butanolivorans TaxID=421767 RepID=UPI0035D9D95A